MSCLNPVREYLITRQTGTVRHISRKEIRTYVSVRKTASLNASFASHPLAIQTYSANITIGHSLDKEISTLQSTYVCR